MAGNSLADDRTQLGVVCSLSVVILIKLIFPNAYSCFDGVLDSLAATSDLTKLLLVLSSSIPICLWVFGVPFIPKLPKKSQESSTSSSTTTTPSTPTSSTNPSSAEGDNDDEPYVPPPEQPFVPFAKQLTAEQLRQQSEYSQQAIYKLISSPEYQKLAAERGSERKNWNWQTRAREDREKFEKERDSDDEEVEKVFGKEKKQLTF